MMKKFTRTLLTLGLSAALLAGCGSSQEKAVKNIKIGITLYDQYDTFLSEMMEGFTAYAAEKEESSKIAINVEILDASKSQLTQNEQVKSLIEKGCSLRESGRPYRADNHYRSGREK